MSCGAGSSRSSPTASVQGEQVSHGLMLRCGECLLQKAPTLVTAWEQQGRVKQQKQKAECPQAPAQHHHDMGIPGRGQGETSLWFSPPNSIDLISWDASHAQWLICCSTCPQISPADANMLYFHIREKGSAASLTRQNLLEEHAFQTTFFPREPCAISRELRFFPSG